MKKKTEKGKRNQRLTWPLGCGYRAGPAHLSFSHLLPSCVSAHSWPSRRRSGRHDTRVVELGIRAPPSSSPGRLRHSSLPLCRRSPFFSISPDAATAVRRADPWPPSSPSVAAVSTRTATDRHFFHASEHEPGSATVPDHGRLPPRIAGARPLRFAASLRC